MDGKISATGHKCVVLVLNMKRFIRPDDQGRFEELRGSPELVRALQDQWPKVLADSKTFIRSQPAEICEKQCVCVECENGIKKNNSTQQKNTSRVGCVFLS